MFYNISPHKGILNFNNSESVNMAYIVVATANAHKVGEYRALLADQKIELRSLADYPG